MKAFILLALLISGCATKGYYVQEKLTLAKVTVHECMIVTYRNVDTDKITTRKQCRDVVMDARQRMDWEKMRDITQPMTIDGDGIEVDDD